MRAVIVALALLFTSTLAVAETPRERAKVLYNKAAQAYDFGEYQKALEGFKAAYAEVQDAAILFNVAQCHRQLGQKVEAVRVYKSFLRHAPESGQAEVKDLIAKLERAIADEQTIKNSPPTGVNPNDTKPTPEPVVEKPVVAPVAPVAIVETAPPPAQPDKKPIVKRWYFWVGLVGGIVLVGGAVGAAVALTTPNNYNYPMGTHPVRF